MKKRWGYALLTIVLLFCVKTIVRESGIFFNYIACLKKERREEEEEEEEDARTHFAHMHMHVVPHALAVINIGSVAI